MQKRAMKDQFMLRLPEGMRSILKAEADKNNRSMNAEIVFQLRQLYQEPKTQKADATA